MLESLFNKVVGLLSLKEDYCEYCDIFKNSIFKEHFWWLFLTKMINANSFKFLMPPPPAPPQKKKQQQKKVWYDVFSRLSLFIKDYGVLKKKTNDVICSSLPKSIFFICADLDIQK